MVFTTVFQQKNSTWSARTVASITAGWNELVDAAALALDQLGKSHATNWANHMKKAAPVTGHGMRENTTGKQETIDHSTIGFQDTLKYKYHNIVHVMRIRLQCHLLSIQTTEVHLADLFFQEHLVETLQSRAVQRSVLRHLRPGRAVPNVEWPAVQLEILQSSWIHRIQKSLESESDVGILLGIANDIEKYLDF